ncbi:MAG TPA: SPOR domain-containing protein [Wenzhouxiangellaceae bacterium]|nr:SPOR domain-containing protein [Wenzhouxiangellaceae bacterium]
MTIRILGLFLALVLVGCDQQGAAWEEAQQEDTIAAYETFVERYPESSQADQAQARIDKLRAERAWTDARQRNTAEAYREFIETHPDAEAADDARERLNTLERETQWQALSDSEDIDALQEFASDYPDSPEAEFAQERISELEARAEAERRQRELEAERERQRQAQIEAAQNTHRVQLAAVGSQNQARRSIELLEQQLGEVLGDSALESQSANGLYLLVTQPMKPEEANALCETLKQRGQDCLVRER